MAQWYIRTYLCDNGVEDKTKFPVPDGELPRKGGNRKRETAIRRAEKGATESKHELARTLNCNFSAGKDRHITLEFDKAGYERLILRAGSQRRDALLFAADHELVNYIKRCQRQCRKEGVELRYVYVVSDMDGKTGKQKRVHAHIVVNAEAAAICCRKWSAGHAEASLLYGGRGGDLGDLAFYMIAQVRKIPNRKKYNPSRNLKKAKPLDPVKAKNPEAELRVPVGCVGIWTAEHRTGRPQHIRYWRPPGVKRDEETCE